jgi:acetyl-CoA/propionyl-CoA carboxylase biotin carboxyl carrier protein
LVLGLVTNLGFLRWLVRQPVVLGGEARTDTLDRIWPPDDRAAGIAETAAGRRPVPAPLPDELWTAAAAALIKSPTATELLDPWAGGWRLNAPPSVRLESGGVVRSVTVTRAPTPTSPVGPVPTLVHVGDTVHIDVEGRSVAFRLAPPPDVDAAARAAAYRHVAGSTGGPVDVRSPMPGAVFTVHVREGQTVEAGDPIVTVEAMKMEHVVAAPSSGRVTELAVRPADQVTRGQLLAVIEP